MTEVHEIESIQQDIPIEVFVSSGSETPDVESPPKRSKGRPLGSRTALWRYKEDGTYDARPCDKAYFVKYAAQRKLCTCGRMILVGDIYKHKKYKICIKMTADRIACGEHDS